MEEQLRLDALEYHRAPTPGKISVTPTKTLVNQRDLAFGDQAQTGGAGRGDRRGAWWRAGHGAGI